MTATLTESIRADKEAARRILESNRRCDQALAESLEWHEALEHFRTDRERQAFKAAFQYAWGVGVADWKLHS